MAKQKTTWEFVACFDEGNHIDFSENWDSLKTIIQKNQDMEISYVALWRSVWDGEGDGLVKRQQWSADCTSGLADRVCADPQVLKKIKAEVSSF